MFSFFRDSLAFATEPVFASLANALGKHEMLPQQAIEELRVSFYFSFLIEAVLIAFSVKLIFSLIVVISCKINL